MCAASQPRRAGTNAPKGTSGAPAGRPSTPMEVYLRLIFLKFRYRLGYETLCRSSRDTSAIVRPESMTR